MPFVYILKNHKGRYYLGSTTDLSRRLRQHVNGHTPSTKRFGKLALVFSQEYSTIEQARRIETKLKRLKRKDYIARIVKDGYIRIV